jgi:hypothetical protein
MPNPNTEALKRFVSLSNLSAAHIQKGRKTRTFECGCPSHTMSGPEKVKAMADKKAPFRDMLSSRQKRKVKMPAMNKLKKLLIVATVPGERNLSNKLGG